MLIDDFSLQSAKRWSRWTARRRRIIRDRQRCGCAVYGLRQGCNPTRSEIWRGGLRRRGIRIGKRDNGGGCSIDRLDNRRNVIGVRCSGDGCGCR